MARYPVLEDYTKRENWADGIARCDELLKKAPADLQLLTTKLQLVHASGNQEEQAEAILAQLVSRQNPVRDLTDVISIEDVVHEWKAFAYPRSRTAGPEVAKLWDGVIKSTASASYKFDIISIRFSRAVVDDRREDAQQALIQLKALQPKNRVAYMAHAAFTQLLSSSSQDLQARLALGLARKAVNENYADEDSALDARVPGQIFALQGAEKELIGVKGTRLGESKQVYDAIRTQNAIQGHQDGTESEFSSGTINSADWSLSELHSLQLGFARLISDKGNIDEISTFAANAVGLFGTAVKDLHGANRRTMADSCFLSISALVRCYDLTTERRFLLYGAFMAELLLRHNPHIHEARLILVYLYICLDLGSLAIRLFDSLGIKEIQYDTVGHSLLTDIATTHPLAHGSGRKNVFDPLKRTAAALAVYSRYEHKLAETQADVLNHGQTGMIFDLQELRDRLHASLSRRITVLQHRRISRLINASSSVDAVIHPRRVLNWKCTDDTRDFKATFDYGYNIEKVLHSREGTLPHETWIVMNLAMDTAWSLSKGEKPLVHDVEILQTLHQTALEESRNTTSSTFLIGTIVKHLLEMLIVTTKRPNDPSTVSYLAPKLTSALNALPITSLTTSSSDPMTAKLRDHYIYIDALRCVLSTFEFLGTFYMDAEVVATSSPIQKLAQQNIEQLQRHAKERQTRIKTADMKSFMMSGDDAGTGKSLDAVIKAVKAVGSEDLHSFCDDVAKSAKAGWDGVVKIKM
nr:n-terminal acetyltransferase b complex subunit arm1 [Quercus suber]